MLDDRRVSLTRAQDEGLKTLQEDKELLKGELKAKKRELDTSTKLAVERRPIRSHSPKV